MSLTLPPNLVESLAQRGKENLYFFLKGILGYKDLVYPVHGPICELLQQPQNTRILCEMPRGSFKSTIISIGYPIWRAVNDPNVKILLVQNTFKNACAKLATIDRTFRENVLFRALYREILPTPQCVWRTESMCVTRKSTDPESTFEAAGANTQVVGRHYDEIIEDDTVAPDLDEMGEESVMPTKEDIGKAIGWHRLMPPLLVHPTRSRNIVVGTRWFETDLISYIKENQKSYRVHSRAIREDALGLPSPTGQSIWPERFPEEVLQEIEADMGPYMFSCLYLNTPVRSDQMVFRPEWVQYYDQAPRNPSLAIYTTVDPAGDPEENLGRTDYNVVLTAAKDLNTGLHYVLHYDRFQGNPGELIDRILNHVKTYRPIKVGVETVNYQQSLLYFLRERKRAEKITFMVEPIRNSRVSKNARITGLQPVLAAGRLFVKTHHQDLVKELMAFPLGKHDDIIDALAMQLPLWRATPSKEEKKQQDSSDDLFSLEALERELTERQRKEPTFAFREQMRLLRKSTEIYHGVPTHARRAASAIRNHWARGR